MPTWADVERICRALPDAEETTSYRQPCFKVNGRPFVNVGRVEGAIVTRAPDEERDLLVQARPDAYFSTPHYDGWEAVLRKLEAPAEYRLASKRAKARSAELDPSAELAAWCAAVEGLVA